MTEEAPVLLAEGVKCPYCPEGVFERHTKMQRDLYGKSRHVEWLRCNKYHFGNQRMSYNYTPESAEFHNGHWAIVRGEVKVLRREQLGK